MVVITDRAVLDQQLQDAIYQIEHRQGAVVRVTDSGTEATQLTDALERGTHGARGAGAGGAGGGSVGGGERGRERAGSGGQDRGGDISLRSLSRSSACSHSSPDAAHDPVLGSTLSRRKRTALL